MHVNVCVVCVRTYVHVVHGYVYNAIQTCTYVRAYVHAYIRINAHIRTYSTCMYVRMYTRMCVRKYMAYVCTYL